MHTQLLLKITFAATIAIVSAFGSYAQSSSAPVALKCEYLVAPIGIDAALPRLSWRLDDNRVSAKQTSYRIFVGTDSIAVSRGTGNYWQTGTINSNAQLIVYGGKPLQPFTRYYWTVQVGDKDGTVSPTKQVTF